MSSPTAYHESHPVQCAVGVPDLPIDVHVARSADFLGFEFFDYWVRCIIVGGGQPGYPAEKDCAAGRFEYGSPLNSQFPNHCIFISNGNGKR